MLGFRFVMPGAGNRQIEISPTSIRSADWVGCSRSVSGVKLIGGKLGDVYLAFPIHIAAIRVGRAAAVRILGPNWTGDAWVAGWNIAWAVVRHLRADRLSGCVPVPREYGVLAVE